MKLRYWHYWVSLLLAIALVPVLRSQHLPLKFDWITLSMAYWCVLAAQSIFVAILLCLIGLPRRQIWDAFLARYRTNPLRIVTLLLFFALLAWTTTWPPPGPKTLGTSLMENTSEAALSRRSLRPLLLAIGAGEPRGA